MVFSVHDSYLETAARLVSVDRVRSHTFSSDITFEPMPTAKEERSFSKRMLDFCLLIGAALALCVVGVGAFIVAGRFQVNPLWVFFGLVSIGFAIGVAEECNTSVCPVRLLCIRLAANKPNGNRGCRRLRRVAISDSGLASGAGSFLHERPLAVWFAVAPPSLSRSWSS